MRFLLPLLLGSAVYLQGQQDPQDLLRQVRERVLNTMDRLPKYMCTQTIDRLSFEPNSHKDVPACERRDSASHAALHLYTSDRLRLNVTVVNKSEIYSWVGDDRFADTSLFDLVGSGPLSTGSYAAFFRMIFAGDDPAFSFNGEVVDEGRKLVEFGFQTPSGKSHYRFGDGRHRWTVPYEGTLLVNPQTLDVVRLVVRTGEVPAESGTCEFKTTLNYGHVLLNDAAVLLPYEARLRIVDANGTEKENHTVYSACHEFVGESKLSFDAPEETVAEPVKRITESPFTAMPAKSRFKLALTQDIDTRVVAAGDLLTGKLTTPIRDRAGKVVVPQGSPVKGRILRVQRWHWPEPGLSISYRVEAVEMGGSSLPLSAVSNSPESGRTATRKSLQSSRLRGLPLGSLSDFNERGTAFLYLSHVGTDGLIHSGLESAWVTVERPR